MYREKYLQPVPSELNREISRMRIPFVDQYSKEVYANAPVLKLGGVEVPNCYRVPPKGASSV